jgi:DNA sulfur modification protein DndD
MKFKQAKFQNFRILQDCKVDFSTDDRANLTVIRAENDTGKTTILTALQWVLFGEEALPNKGSDYRLHPIDWEDYSKPVDIKVELEFEHTTESRSGSEIEKDTYVAIRQVKEYVKEANNVNRENGKFNLYRKKPHVGLEPIKGAQLYLSSMVLGSNLKDLFFTDGDRALSFISAEISTSDQRKLVKQAIRDMLGLEILENSNKRVSKYIRDKRKQIKKTGIDEDTERMIDYVNAGEEEIDRFEERLNEIADELSEINISINKYDKKIEQALEKGNRENIQKLINKTKKQLNSYREAQKLKVKEHGKFLESDIVFKLILRDKIKNTSDMLEDLWKNEKLPKTAVPVLKEYLESGICVCGRELKNDSEPHLHLVELIEEQKQATEVDKRLTTLRSVLSEDQSLENIRQSFRQKIERLSQELETIETNIHEAEIELKELDNQLDQIPDTDVEFLREQRKIRSTKRDELIQERVTKEDEVADLEEELKDAKGNLETVMKRESKLQKFKNDLTSAEDLNSLLGVTYDKIEKKEIEKVSDLMNSFFLEMIRSDPDQKVIIEKCEITEDYDINAYAPNGKILNPDNDLNGASRRALTLSFILALTNVSGVEAPNVIDTPLGMMDPLVKESVLTKAVEESYQLIMLLTRSEINDIESILDKKAGKVLTLSNAAHYDTKLLNDPGVDNQAIRCDCNHRQYCDICERIGDKDSNLKYRTN